MSGRDTACAGNGGAYSGQPAATVFVEGDG